MMHTFSKDELTELVKFYNRYFQMVEGSLHQSEVYFVHSIGKWFELVYSPNSNYLAYCFGDREDFADDSYIFHEDETILIPDEQFKVIYQVVIQHRNSLIERNKANYDVIKRVGDHDDWLSEEYINYKVYPN